LNLGQNEFSGEIPLEIGDGRTNGGTHLISVRQFIRELTSLDGSLDGFGNTYANLQQNFVTLLSKYPYIKQSKDLLWIDRSYWKTIELRKLLDEYIKAEENHFVTKLFQNVRRIDPIRLVEYLESTSTGRLLTFHQNSGKESTRKRTFGESYELPSKIKKIN
jgi:hypothetical protein